MIYSFRVKITAWKKKSPALKLKPNNDKEPKILKQAQMFSQEIKVIKQNSWETDLRVNLRADLNRGFGRSTCTIPHGKKNTFIDFLKTAGKISFSTLYFIIWPLLWTWGLSFRATLTCALNCTKYSPPNQRLKVWLVSFGCG